MSGMAIVSGGGAFTRQNISDINSNFSQVLPFTSGNIIYLNPASANTLAQDGSAQRPYTTLAAAYSATRNGMNDVIVLVGNGATSATARVEAAFTWSNNATHLIGIASPVLLSQRARIAPTGSTTAFSPFFTVSGSGCLFQNIEWFHGFTTGMATEICMTVTGSRNYFKNCQFAGMADTDHASADGAGSRHLKIGSAGSGENVFEDCTIGEDTTARTTTNASVELAGGTPRNIFRRCYFPVFATNAGVLGILGTGNACVDRFNEFHDCVFVNSIKSGAGTAMTALGSFTTGAPGGLVVLKGCAAIGVTKFGDTNFLANSYIDMAAVSASAGGLGVNPS